MAISATRSPESGQRKRTILIRRACPQSNDAQIITMGARVIGPELAKFILGAWLNSEFEPLRSGRESCAYRKYEEIPRQ